MTLFPELAPPPRRERTTFRDNAKLPIHSWFKYSAGFSADWVVERLRRNPDFRVIGDPFAGSGTTLIASALEGRESYGFESHPFVYRVAEAKLKALELDSETFLLRSKDFIDIIGDSDASEEVLGNELMLRIFDPTNLQKIARMRSAVDNLGRDGYDSVLWLAVMATLRSASHVGTASWQYVLPNKSKMKVSDATAALSIRLLQFRDDIVLAQSIIKSNAHISSLDSRHPDNANGIQCDALITSPPYANNFDYADATRIEMTFLGEVSKWGDLQSTVREHIVRSSTQHVSPYKRRSVELFEEPILQPISVKLRKAYDKMAELKKIRAGKKDYDAMIAYYFYDMAHCLTTSRRMLREGGRAYFVIGDSAPYGVHIPVEEFLGDLALSLGFRDWKFAKERDRNIKWKNRKHDHPLKEGFLVLRG